MQYKPTTTIAKTATPAAVIIAGAELIQAGAKAAGMEIGGETSYIIMTGVYSFFRGLINYIKNRRKR